MSRVKQSARVMDHVLASKPTRDVLAEAADIWSAVNRLMTAPHDQIRANRGVLMNVRNKLNLMIGDEQ